MKKTLLFIVIAALLSAACTPAQIVGLLGLVFAPPAEDAPLGGQIAALPTPDLAAVPTPTPPPSSISFPTPAPPVAPPLATLTAVAGMLPTQDTSATPYVLTFRGRPHFIEFHAWW